MRKSDIPLQQIFYGAPGTGKSHAINELTAGKDVIRTTFHPDTDYSTFVGAYKPTTKSVPVITVIGTEAVPVRDKNGKEMMEDKIVYEYVSQAFLQAYVAAWRKYCDVQEGEEPVDEFLVIEEINRGNCAQIFGDLFQLLDRGDEGFSEYPIKADSDMKKLLEKEFEGLKIKNKEGINALFKGDKDIVAQVLAGDILLLPNNLYIWATMNTSDQSLFPIDSAFKRRWDWHYVPISDAGKKWMIEVNGAQYDWWKFLEAINDKVYHATYSEDKKMGYFFCKANDCVISAEKFVSKVIFYLWNDVFKDSEFEGDTFKDEDGEKLSFDKFYDVKNKPVKVNEKKIVKFLSNLNLEPDSEADEDNSEEGFETEGDKKLPKTSKVFSVEFPDGTVINENNKFDTYHKTLSKIGIEQVEKIAAEMKYHRLHTPLVTKSKYEAILNKPEYSYIQEGDCFIVKGINNITMYRMVMLLDNRLDLQLKVCYE
ncbi:AAA family ATPase [Segatella copri]|nr:AAA family ATPase [Segatella copri]